MGLRFRMPSDLPEHVTKAYPSRPSLVCATGESSCGVSALSKNLAYLASSSSSGICICSRGCASGISMEAVCLPCVSSCGIALGSSSIGRFALGSSSAPSSSELSSTRKPPLTFCFAGSLDAFRGGGGRFIGNAGEELGGYAIGDEGAAIFKKSKSEAPLESLVFFLPPRESRDVEVGCRKGVSCPMFNDLENACAINFHLDATYRQRAYCRDLEVGA